jgi:hypothetical protein
MNGHMDARADARGGMSEKSIFVYVADSIKTHAYVTINGWAFRAPDMFQKFPISGYQVSGLLYAWPPLIGSHC